MKNLIKNRVPTSERDAIIIPDDGELLPDGLINTLALFEGTDGRVSSSAQALSYVLDDIDVGTSRLLGCPYDHELLRKLVFDTCERKPVTSQVPYLCSQTNDEQLQVLSDALRILHQVFDQYSISSDEVLSFHEASLQPTAGHALLAILRTHQVGEEVLGKLSWIFRSLNDDLFWWLIAFSDLPTNAVKVSAAQMENEQGAERSLSINASEHIAQWPCLDVDDVPTHIADLLARQHALRESEFIELLDWLIERAQEVEICQSVAEKFEDEF